MLTLVQLIINLCFMSPIWLFSKTNIVNFCCLTKLSNYFVVVRTGCYYSEMFCIACTVITIRESKNNLASLPACHLLSDESQRVCLDTIKMLREERGARPNMKETQGILMSDIIQHSTPMNENCIFSEAWRWFIIIVIYLIAGLMMSKTLMGYNALFEDENKI